MNVQSICVQKIVLGHLFMRKVLWNCDTANMAYNKDFIQQKKPEAP
jgi:hypothetical protein